MAQDDREGDHPPLSVDSVLEVLSHYQRREILRFVRDLPDNKVPMQRVINHLRDVERSRTGKEPGTDHLQSVLIHVHGPKLSAVEIIEYDVEDQYVEFIPNRQIENALEHLDFLEEEWEPS